MIIALVIIVLFCFTLQAISFFVHQARYKNVIDIVKFSFVILCVYRLNDLYGIKIDWGFSPRALIMGGLISVSILIILYTLSRFKAGKSFFIDSRNSGMSPKQKLRKLFGELLIETVLYEEILFRGIIYSVLARLYNPEIAILFSALLFGAWHFLPALSFAKNNRSSAKVRVASTVGLNLIATALAGMILGIARFYGGGLILPVMLHYFTNASALGVSWLQEGILNTKKAPNKNKS